MAGLNSRLSDVILGDEHKICIKSWGKVNEKSVSLCPNPSRKARVALEKTF